MSRISFILKNKKVIYSMLKNKTCHIYVNLVIFIFSLLLVKASNSSEINCVNQETKIECNYKIQVNSKNASDLGTYNISISLNKIKKINGVFNGQMYINSGLCENELVTVMEENMQIAQAHDSHGYNFPLFLHRGEIEADFCVEILITNCIDSCGDLISLDATLSPIMKMQRR